MLKTLGATALAGIIAGPALAADLAVYEPLPPAAPMVYDTHNIVGHLEMGLGFIHFDYNRGSETDGVFDGAGRFNINWNQNWNVQVDLNASAVFSSNYSEAIATPMAHLWYGTPTHAVGAYLGTGFGFGDPIWFGGVEGEWYWGNTTLGGLLGFAHNDYDTALNARAWVKHYINPNLKIAGDLTYLDWGPGVWSIEGEIEHRHSHTPISGFASIGYLDPGRNTSIWTGLVGFRLFADAPGSTLQSHDRQVPWKFNAALVGGDS